MGLQRSVLLVSGRVRGVTAAEDEDEIDQLLRKQEAIDAEIKQLQKRLVELEEESERIQRTLELWGYD